MRCAELHAALPIAPIAGALAGPLRLDELAVAGGHRAGGCG